MSLNFSNDQEAVDSLSSAYKNLKSEIGKVIVGQDEVVSTVLISLFSNGHSLLVGVPGLAKTLLVSTISQVLDLDFKRIQFTPDLMPSDITGAEILDESRSFKFNKGPLFSNIVLADEIMFNIPLDYPSYAEEIKVVKETTTGKKVELGNILTAEQIIAYQQLVRKIPIADNVLEYAVSLASKTRPGTEMATEAVNKYIAWGAGPRASQYLVLGAKTHAAIQGKYSPDKEDVQAIAKYVLRHRIVRNYKAEAEGISEENVIDGLI